jgi:hypothetical protein
MRCLGVLVVLGACGGNPSAKGSGAVPLSLEIPHGALDPKGYTTVEIVLHAPSGDVRKSTDLDRDAAAPGVGSQGPAPVLASAAFDAIDLDPGTMVAVEATLRNDSGTAVGYGRTAVDTAFVADEPITVQVRRPLAYIAGSVSRDPDNDANTPGLRWTETPATFSDLSAGLPLDGKTQVGSQVVLAVAAGPNLYTISQAIDATTGALVGPAKLVPVSTADHQVGSALAGSMSGSALDGAGADDGHTLAIATSTQLFAFDAQTGMSRALADGNFARVAVLTSHTGEIDAVAIKNRGVTTAATCSMAAELWWLPVSRSDGGVVGPPQMIAIGGFSDVATDRGRAYYVDACRGMLGDVADDGSGKLAIHPLVTLPAIPGLAPGRPSAIAVSNDLAYVGIESPPATASLMRVSIAAAPHASDEPSALWSEAAQQVVRASDFRGVQRQLDATSAMIGHLEIGAGGDYIAITTSAHFHGDPVIAANFPEMTIDTEELRVFDASTGGLVQRYRSWCLGVLKITAPADIDNWACASTAGQTEAAKTFDHHIGSMTFLFGKK